MPFIQTQAARFLNKAKAVNVDCVVNIKELNSKQKDQYSILEFASMICRAFNFAPRQIETLFRIFFHLIAVEETEKTSIKSWLEASILLLAIFIDDRLLYNRVGTASVPVQELYAYIKKLNFSSIEHSNDENYIVCRAMSFSMQALNDDELDQIADIYLMYNGKPELELNKGLRSLRSRRNDATLALSFHLTGADWGRIDGISGFQKIYTRIEQWSDYIE